MADVSQWLFRNRDYTRERAEAALERQSSNNIHPLAPTKKAVVVVKNDKTAHIPPSQQKPKVDVDDPLSGLLSEPNVTRNKVVDDPLSSADVSIPTSTTTESVIDKSAPDIPDLKGAVGPPDLTAWTVKKQTMIRDYSSSAAMQRATTLLVREVESSRKHLAKRQSAMSKSLDDDDPPDVGLVTSTKAPKLVERAAARLNQLERGEEANQKSGEAEFLEQLTRSHAQIHRHWVSEERVAALKATISVAKVLKEASANFVTYYPSLFVVSTEVLDTFGWMVYSRIEAKNQTNPTEAKETCRNWFYKTACIRELVPRFYVETSLLPCYKFLTDKDYPQILSRLASIVRGIASPLCAFYARAYLARQAAQLVPFSPAPSSSSTSSSIISSSNSNSNGKYGVMMARDMLFCFQDVKKSPPSAKESRHPTSSLSMTAIVKTLDPAVESALGRLDRDDPNQFSQVLAQYRDYCNDATVLKRILEAFSPALTADKAAAVVGLAKRAEPSHTSTVSLLAALGQIFADSPPPRDQRLAVLNEVWKVVTRCNDLSDYVRCAATWLDCLLKHYGDREVSVLLNDVIKHVKHVPEGGAGGDDDDANALEDLVQMLVQSCSKTVLASDHVLKLLDLFRPHRKVEISKEFLKAHASSADTFADPVLIHAVLEIGRVAHDALDSLSPEGESRHVANLIIAFIDRVDLGRDLERQLAVYVECRAAFHNLDPVLDRLVVLSATLAVTSKKVASRALSRKKDKSSASRLAERAQNFSKACLAYAHVTIPSIDHLFRRLDLLALCGHVALLNQCLPHADTFFKAAVALVPELPAEAQVIPDSKAQPGELALRHFVARLAGSLVLVPGHPDHGPFYLVQGLLNALPRYQHWTNETHYKIAAYLALLPLLGAYAQRRLPYSVVEANDVLYGGAQDYFDELKTHLTTLVNAILEDLAQIPDSLARAELVLDLLNAIALTVRITGDAAQFANKLFSLANKHKQLAPAPLQQYLLHTQTKLQQLAQHDALPLLS